MKKNRTYSYTKECPVCGGEMSLEARFSCMQCRSSGLRKLSAEVNALFFEDGFTIAAIAVSKNMTENGVANLIRKQNPDAVFTKKMKRGKRWCWPCNIQRSEWKSCNGHGCPHTERCGAFTVFRQRHPTALRIEHAVVG